MRTNHILAVFAISALSLFTSAADAREVVEIDPLFEYPMAPENIETLNGKSNYLMEHFWDAMDFKKKEAVDQNAVNDAMRVYATPLRWADKQKADASVTKLLDKLSKNPTLLLQFTKGAEEALYSQRAEIWIDEVYIKFLEAVEKNKKIPKERKKRYLEQLTSLSNTLNGARTPDFTFEGRNGSRHTYTPMSTATLIIFGDPKATDWRLARLRLETNVPLMQAVEKGKVNILYIVTKEDKDWEDTVASYPSNWTVGYAPQVGSIFDIRVVPSIYVIDSEGKIMMKNSPLDQSVAAILNLI